MKLSKKASENIIQALKIDNTIIEKDTLLEIRNALIRYKLMVAYVGSPNGEDCYVFVTKPNDIETAEFDLEALIDSLD